LKREFDEKKWLNMNSRPDKECEKRGDIVLLSEIIANSIYWQAMPTLYALNSKQIIEKWNFQRHKQF
jgi:hypothetical protein